MTEPPNRAPLDRFSHWYPPFPSAAAPTVPVVELEPEQLPPPPAPTWLTPGDEPDPTLPVRDGRGKRKLAVAGAAAAVVAVVVGVVAVFTSTSGDASGNPVAAGWCTASRDGATVVGNGPGGTTDGVAAILAFDHAYYVERSGAKAREVVAPDAPLGSAETIQGGIDSLLPEGTEHCLAITETEPGHYAVTLSELRPDGSTKQYEQVVTTADRDGRTYITSIGDAK
ncbi:hypothetical protein [Rhodococcus sp. NPDC057529]|uniref:hypothetical protein n=1 Tax=Rhodococcus sp. NPDC057529 TaxID=3346158 RepID=UPI00366F21BF